jgi:hypothetical protein
VGALAVAMLLTTGLTLWAASGQNAADAAVAGAVTSAINDRTATLSMNGSESLAGASISISGSGAMDFTQNDMRMQVDLSVAGQELTANAVYLDKSVYINLGDLVGKVLPGKSWVSLNFGQLSGGKAGASPLGLGASSLPNDPVAVLTLLGADGNTATDLGPSTIKGVAVEGYSVKVDAAAIRAEISGKSLPSWMRPALSTVSNPDVSYKVFINQSGELVRQTQDVTLKESGVTLHEVGSIDFSDYGVPVTITVPPAGQVATFQQFVQAASIAGAPTLA